MLDAREEVFDVCFCEGGRGREVVHEVPKDGEGGCASGAVEEVDGDEKLEGIGGEEFLDEAEVGG